MKYYAYEDAEKCDVTPKIPVIGPKPINNGEKSFSQFSIGRPSYKSGTMQLDLHAKSIDGINRRSGLGNAEINRNNFTPPDLIGRQLNAFPSVQLESPDNIFELGEKSLAQLTEAKIPDPKDFEWIAEDKVKRRKIRRILIANNPGLNPSEILALLNDELRQNPPLGREQRTTIEKRTIGSMGESATKDLATKLREIKSEIASGKVTNTANKNQLLGELAKLLSETPKILLEMASQRETLAEVFIKLGSVDLVYKNVFVADQRRIVSRKWLDDDANRSMLLLYTMSYVSSQKPLISYIQPMWNITQEEGKTEPGKFRMKPVSLQYVMKETNKVGSSKRYFDLKTRSMINVNQLVFLSETTPGVTKLDDILDPTILGQPGVMAVITASTSKTAKGNDQITELPDTINAGRNGAPPPPSYYAL